MGNRIRFHFLLVLIILLALAMFFGVGWVLAALHYNVRPDERTILYFVVAGMIVITAIAIVYVTLYKAFIKPLGSLLQGAKIMANVNPTHKLELPSFHLLGDVPEAIHNLGKSLQKANEEIEDAVTAGAAATEKQKAKLEVILQEFNEGVIVCDKDARVLLYNPAARRLFRNNESLGLGRSLYEICTRAPIDHTWELLLHRRVASTDTGIEEGHASFICATLKEGVLLNCRMTLIPQKSKLKKAIFIMTFEDVSQQDDAMGRKANLIRSRLQELRAPLANLRAAAENLASNPDMDLKLRNTFKNVIEQESSKMTNCFARLSHVCRYLISAEWPLADVFSADLFGCMTGRLLDQKKLHLSMVGMPLWLRADSHGLMLVLEYIARKIYQFCNKEEIEIEFESLLGDRHIYIDFVWQGDPIPHAIVEAWLNQPLPDSIGTLMVKDVLERHACSVWSQKHQRIGYAVFRIPMPASSRQWEKPQENMPDRPEFYDFSVADQKQNLGSIADRPLSSFDYVVFDTETTGLHPSSGDEIIAIGAVRIANRRILPGEHFMKLVNPQRIIPPASIRIHGITGDMVKDQPTLHQVLPEFKNFVGDAVLVAHNAAFDMKFIHMKENECQIHFDNLVLDTLLLSVLLHNHTPDHTLGGIAKRLGVEIQGRHTALGDSLVTAQVFVRLLDLLEANKISTIGEAISASEKLVEVRKQQAQH